MDAVCISPMAREGNAFGSVADGADGRGGLSVARMLSGKVVVAEDDFAVGDTLIAPAPPGATQGARISLPRDSAVRLDPALSALSAEQAAALPSLAVTPRPAPPFLNPSARALPATRASPRAAPSPRLMPDAAAAAAAATCARRCCSRARWRAAACPRPTPLPSAPRSRAGARWCAPAPRRRRRTGPPRKGSSEAGPWGRGPPGRPGGVGSRACGGAQVTGGAAPLGALALLLLQARRARPPACPALGRREVCSRAGSECSAGHLCGFRIVAMWVLDRGHTDDKGASGVST